LFQTGEEFLTLKAIAVLEQPSSGRMTGHLLGRRNIVLSQSDELNSTLLDH